MTPFLSFSIFVAFLFLIFILYKYVYLETRKKKEGKFIRIFLYENVGGKPVYIGEKLAEEKHDKAIGSFLLIKKIKVPLKRISNSDFIQDKVYGKALHVVKFADDDYRPLVRLSNENWYRKEYVPQMEQIPETDEEGNAVIVEQQAVDQLGKPVYDERLVKYDEPLGINQVDRDVLMFNKIYYNRMDEKYKVAEGKWAKLLPFIQVAVVGMILLIGFVYMTKSMNETQLQISSTWDANAKSILDEQNNPSFIQNIANQIRQKDDEVNAPPT